MDIPQLYRIVDHNGEALEALVDVLNVREQLHTRMTERQAVKNKERYQQILANYRAAASKGEARETAAGAGTQIFGQWNDGTPIVIGFDALTQDQQTVIAGKVAGDAIVLGDRGEARIEAVFDPRKPAPAAPPNHPRAIQQARKKRKRRR
jgi:hypothetical protein